MMVEKIEKFNKSGKMEGATYFGAKHFTSMKQDVLDLCDSRYDAKVMKYCKDENMKVRSETWLYNSLFNFYAPFHRILMNYKSE